MARALWRSSTRMPVLRAARLLALALPAAAHADATVSVSGGTLTFTATDAVATDHYTHVGVTSGGHVEIYDDGGITILSGCAATDSDTADCGPPTSYTRLDVTFGAGEDLLDT